MNLDNVIAVRADKTVYRDGDRCIKLFNENYSKSDVFNEALNQARIEETGLNIPKILDIELIDGKWAIITEFIEGKTLAEIMEQNPDNIDGLLEEFVDIQLSVHNQKSPLLTKLKDKMNRKIHEAQLDEIIYDEVRLLLIRIQEQSKKYDKIVRDWQRQKPAYERKIEQYKARITALRQQIEELILERISDREHASVYNGMITKREEEITELQQKIEESKQFDEVGTRKRNELKTTADLLEKMIEEQHISDANLRLLVKTVYVHQNEDKSLDVRLEFNGDFEDSVAVYVEGESA